MAAVEWSSKGLRADMPGMESALASTSPISNSITGVQAEIYYRKVGNEVPHLAVRLG